MPRILCTILFLSVPVLLAPWRVGDGRALPSRWATSAPEQLGKVDFPTSCALAAQAAIEKGVALLHSFQYTESQQAFSEASKQDPKCAMAHWGKAMALYYQLWEFPNDKTLKQGRKEIEKARKLRPGTPREQGFLEAAAAFYLNKSKMTHTARVQAYSAALEHFYAQSPCDPDIGAFYALSLISLAYSDEANTTTNLQKAIAVLTPLLQQHPDHPGAAHYLIHASDMPELALQGLPAARAYAKIAPDSAHALHMPSHIFQRLGLWQETIDSNLASAAAAAKATEVHAGAMGALKAAKVGGGASYQFHAMDFLDYAYLQSGQEAKARNLVEEVKHVPGASKGDIIDQQNLFAARNALELHRWKEAASLDIPQERFEWQDISYWTRTIGAARSGDVAGARADVQKLSETIQAREASQRKQGNEVAPGASVDQLEAEGWLAYAEGKPAEAVTKLRSAAHREEAKHSHPFAMPAREMLADLLLELKRQSEALVEYEAVLKSYPNRFDALLGAARAAEGASDAAAARNYYAKLVEICNPAADRPELPAVKTFLAQN